VKIQSRTVSANMKRLSIAIPASVVADTPHLREKTSKIGLIGRAAAIFRVSEVIIYSDNPSSNQSRDMSLITTLLAYMETPQYLRKALFKLSPDLQYAGILPPLRTAHHPLNRKGKDLKVGEYREGVVLSRTRSDYFVDIGIEGPVLLRNAELPIGKRITVRVAGISKPIEVKTADACDVPCYWGYHVTSERHSLGEIVHNRNFGLTLATSKFGKPFVCFAGQIGEKWERVDDVLVTFGAPSTGLNEIVKREGLCLNDLVDFVVNTIPLQGTQTVRTEEAIIASLATFNVFFATKSNSADAS
jgi:predicted SPOUT superfamily RNA methylase MTH1